MAYGSHPRLARAFPELLETYKALWDLPMASKGLTRACWTNPGLPKGLMWACPRRQKTCRGLRMACQGLMGLTKSFHGLPRAFKGLKGLMRATKGLLRTPKGLPIALRDFLRLLLDFKGHEDLTKGCPRACRWFAQGFHALWSAQRLPMASEGLANTCEDLPWLTYASKSLRTSPKLCQGCQGLIKGQRA